MYTLYYYPGNASLLPHLALREIGAPFELRLVDREQNEQCSAEYLQLNPNGRIPVFVDGDLVLYETAAITLYLAERHAHAGLAPPRGSADHARFLTWMIHLTNTPQAEYRPWFYPWEHVTDHAADATVKQAAGERLGRMFGVIADQLGDGPWLLGSAFRQPTCSCSCWFAGDGRCRVHHVSCRLSRRMRSVCLLDQPSRRPWPPRV